MDRLERLLLLHLLEHRGQQIRFEASQWTTEFGITRKFSTEDPNELKQALRSLEMSRMIYLRTQYVVGYSEPKHVYSLTPSGHRKALEFRREESSLIEENDGPPDGMVSEDAEPPTAPRRPGGRT
jgi:DNA-binding PadR family transcriptional regulator